MKFNAWFPLFVVTLVVSLDGCSATSFGVASRTSGTKSGVKLHPTQHQTSPLLELRGGGGTSSELSTLTSVTSHLALASWLYHGFVQACCPIPSLKRAGVTIEPNSGGHMAAELTGWILIGTVIVMALTHYFPDLVPLQAVVLSYLPLDVYCIANWQRCTQGLGVSSTFLALGTLADVVYATMVWLDPSVVPKFIIYVSFNLIAALGVLMPGKLAEWSGLKLTTASDRFSWSLALLAFAMYTTAVTTVLLGGTGTGGGTSLFVKAVRNTLLMTAALNLWSRLFEQKSHIRQAGLSDQDQNYTLLWVVGLTALLLAGSSS